LTGLIPQDSAGNFIEKIAFDMSLIQTTVYYRYYLNRALEKSGRGDLYLKLLDPWTRMLDLGLSTFAEKNDPTPRMERQPSIRYPLHRLRDQVHLPRL
jgi:hypothetical protein